MKERFDLAKVGWPELGLAERPAEADAAELAGRLEALRRAARARGLTHVVVYGDREHFANVAWLTGYDPRFEEALAVVGFEREPLLMVGNEGEGYLPVSASWRAGALRAERFPTFSLLDQPRAGARALEDILSGEGVGPGAMVGTAGWKYFGRAERPDAARALEIPSYIADCLRDLAGRERVANATDLFMNPRDGLRATASPTEIAFFEYTNVLASDGMKGMLRGMREGMSDHDLAKLAGYNGEPLGCYMTIVTGRTWERSLSGPVGARLGRGEPFAGNVCYWGSNCCRAGWIAESERDLPKAARDYLAAFAGPYVAAMGEWFRELRVGVTGDRLHHAVHDLLPDAVFGITLNAGHLIHLDEWLSSPVYAGSDIPLRSGMVVQSDVIPSSRVYASSRMEDGYVIADPMLQERLRSEHPSAFARCLERRRFMRESLGLPVQDDVLPLSNIPGVVPPFLLDPDRLLVLRH
jgi:Xaa-Pro aminopeptidase